MGTTILVSNQKGGVGKTTISSNLAMALADRGYQVGVIDSDPQGHISYVLGILNQRGEPYEGIFNLLVNSRVMNVDLGDVVIPIERGKGRIELLPGGPYTALAGIQMQMQNVPFSYMGELVAPMIERCDYILVDTSPAVSMLTPSLLAMANYVLIPTDMASLDINGVNAVVKTMAQFAGNHDADLVGILPTKTQPNTNEYREQLDRLKQTYPGYVWDDFQLTYSTYWKEATDVAKPILDYAPASHKSHREMVALVDHFIEMTQGVAHVG